MKKREFNEVRFPPPASQHNRRVRSRGLSLLEVLLATFMFVTVMVSLMDVWVAHARAFDKSQGQEVASMLGQQVMEQELALGFQAQAVTTPVNYSVLRTMRGQVESSVFNYTVSVTPAAVGMEDMPNPWPAPYGASPLYQIIVVTVKWSDSTGDHTSTMECNGGW